MTSARSKVSELQAVVKDLEESLTTSQKELIKAQEQAVKYQRDLREVSGLHILVRVHCTLSADFTTKLYGYLQDSTWSSTSYMYACKSCSCSAKCTSI